MFVISTIFNSCQSYLPCNLSYSITDVFNVMSWCLNWQNWLYANVTANCCKFLGSNYIDESLCCMQMDWKPSQREVRKKICCNKNIFNTVFRRKNRGLNLKRIYAVQIHYKFSVSDLYKSPHPEPTPFSNHSVISKPKWIDYVLCSLCIVGEYMLTKDKGALRH